MKKHTVGSAHLPHLRRSTRYLLVALFPLLVCWLLFMRQSREWAMNISEQNAVRMLDKNALLIDQRMNSIERSLYALSNDDRFNELVASTSYRSSNTYYSNQRKMSPIVSQYFWDFDGFCSFYIVSSQTSSPRMTLCRRKPLPPRRNRRCGFRRPGTAMSSAVTSGTASTMPIST